MHRRPYHRPILTLKRAGFGPGHALDTILSAGRLQPSAKARASKVKRACYEFLRLSGAMGDMILRGAPLSQIRTEGRRLGYIPLFEAGLQKVARGMVSLEELLKETSNIEDYAFEPERAPVMV
jgi:type II secretory ATPase GspE/PulE/Tfp pilus assembly ATPase PilB-like protein